MINKWIKSRKSVKYFFNHDSLFICLTAQSGPAGAGLSDMPPTLLGLAIALAWGGQIIFVANQSMPKTLSTGLVYTKIIWFWRNVPYLLRLVKFPVQPPFFSETVSNTRNQVSGSQSSNTISLPKELKKQ